MKLPMRQKYVDEAVGTYIIFGTHPDGTVGVYNAHKDVFTGLPKDVAEAVVKAHAEFVEKLYSLLCKEES